jgi:DNA-binding transcriptional LysR family regulator
MDRLVSMAVFKRTVDVGSFAAAARHFRISPEMAGNHVRALEAHLGVRLLNRSTRRLHLTEAGSGYYARCKQILADIEEAEAEANLLQATPRGLLRVAAPVTFGVLHIAPAASDYMMRYPEVTFDVAISDRFVDLIEEGFDVAIRIGDLQDSNLIARRIATARLVTCASPAYVRRAGTPQAPADLSRHACLIYTGIERAPTAWRFEAPDGSVETVRVSGPLTATNAAFVHRMALAGHGVIHGPSFAASLIFWPGSSALNRTAITAGTTAMHRRPLTNSKRADQHLRRAGGNPDPSCAQRAPFQNTASETP